MKPAVRSFLVFLAVWIPLTAVLFLLLSGFLSSWSGQMVSVRAATPDQTTHQVLVVQDDGSRFEATWPVDAVLGLDLKIDRLALPPSPLPKGLARTQKQRFTLTFTVVPDGGTAREISTATPQTFALTILALVGGILLRNMVVAGNPLSLDPKGVELVKAQKPPGRVADPGGGDDPPTRRPRPKQGPPPPRPRRGSGRRG